MILKKEEINIITAFLTKQKSYTYLLNINEKKKDSNIVLQQKKDKKEIN